MVHVTSAFLFASLLLNAASSSFALPLSVRHDSVVARALPVGAIEPVFAREVDFAPNLVARQAVTPLEPSSELTKRDSSPQRQHARDIYYIGPNAGKGCRPRPAASTQTGQTSQLGQTGQQIPQTGQQIPQTGQQIPQTGQQIPQTGQQIPQTGQQIPQTGQTPATGATTYTGSTLTGATQPQPASGQTYQGGQIDPSSYIPVSSLQGGQQGGQQGGLQGGTTSLTGYTGTPESTMFPPGTNFPNASLTGAQQSGGQIDQSQTLGGTPPIVGGSTPAYGSVSPNAYTTPTGTTNTGGGTTTNTGGGTTPHHKGSTTPGGTTHKTTTQTTGSTSQSG